MANMNKKWLFLITTLVALGVLIIATLMLKGQVAQEPFSQNQPSPSIAPTAPSTSSVPATSTIETKTYRNTEYGFEFQYPSDLVVRENTFRSYYSKFNLQVEYWDKEGKYLSVFDVNIVLLEFADRTFLGSGATTSTVIVNGISGIKYEYEFESLPEVAVVLPFGQYKVILGIGGSSKFYGHESTFNQVLASFKFLK